MDPPPSTPPSRAQAPACGPDSPKQTAAAPLGSAPAVGTRRAAGEEFTASMAGWQLGLQMWGSPEPGDSVTPKWSVCFPRRDGNVRGCLGLEDQGRGLIPTPPSPPALLLGPFLDAGNLESAESGA